MQFIDSGEGPVGSPARERQASERLGAPRTPEQQAVSTKLSKWLDERRERLVADGHQLGLRKLTIKMIEDGNAICECFMGGKPDWPLIRLPLSSLSDEDRAKVEIGVEVHWYPASGIEDDTFLIPSSPTLEQLAESLKHARQFNTARREQEARMATEQGPQGLERTFNLDQ